MKVFLSTALLTVVMTSSINVFAADESSISMGKLLDVEAQITMKKMRDELEKPAPGSAAVQVVQQLTPAPKPTFVEPRPVTQSIYGNSGHYLGQIAFGTESYSVSVGKNVREYVVTNIDSNGIYLEKTVILPKRQKRQFKHAKTTQILSKQTVFAPLLETIDSSLLRDRSF
ncbi:MAG: hypothetical protein Q7K26_01905 [bacterium]|nr:hypothetical protein [bacterium]